MSQNKKHDKKKRNNICNKVNKYYVVAYITLHK